MNHPVVWFEVTGKKSDQLSGFYSSLFGWKINADNPMKYGMVDTGSKEGIPGGIGPAQNGSTHVTFYVASKDLQASLDEAEKLGAKTILPVTKADQVTIALFSDPEGNVVGLVEQ